MKTNPAPRRHRRRPRRQHHRAPARRPRPSRRGPHPVRQRPRPSAGRAPQGRRLERRRPRPRGCRRQRRLPLHPRLEVQRRHLACRTIPAERAILDAAGRTGAVVVFPESLYAYGEVAGPITEDLPTPRTRQARRPRRAAPGPCCVGDADGERCRLGLPGPGCATPHAGRTDGADDPRRQDDAGGGQPDQPRRPSGRSCHPGPRACPSGGPRTRPPGPCTPRLGTRDPGPPSPCAARA